MTPSDTPTLSSILDALEAITGKSFTVSDLLKRVPLEEK